MKPRWSSVAQAAFTLWQLLGVPTDRTSHTEKLISGLGAALGILAVYAALCCYSLDQATILLIASVAASSVLVFAVPHGALSQPWPVLGSYLLSAVIGVTCFRWLDSTTLSAVLAVGLSVSAMHYARCLHPPGGAVALIAVTGGTEIHELGYGFVVVPALANAVILVCAGILFNSFFPWRRYPIHLLHLRPHPHPLIEQHHLIELTLEDYHYAIQQQDSFIDVSAEDLAELVDCAREHALGTQGLRSKSAKAPRKSSAH